MTPNIFISLLLFAVVLYGSPGPATLSLAASGKAYGFKQSTPYLAGLVTGVFLNFLLVAVGVATLFQIYPLAYEFFRYFSLAFILYLAYRIALSGKVESRSANPLRYQQGVVLNLLNPKAYVAALVTLTQFAQPGEAYVVSVAGVVLVVTLVAALVDVGWAYLGTVLARVFSSPQQAQWMNVTMAAILALAAVYATFFLD